ncbi:DUF177 domain-containing protein [Campylobacter helveticus]|uniref:DUF177 domain-containing protein n=1 Tax=Campylobacter helveticus TaxID=28898 RepID=A0AAX2UJ67_9BACT|nr:hypothetical protein [Campylobacter helveticus]ARE80226.1 hypothetical protein CHELV3228_0603 [Campylobacter helveticus]MCR2054360.1 DUF177 domain-containing protein [Campylobacter helveticus]MCR2056670.1 DUF177 domain-containing protein [Campylobacter helveticus]MCR2059883.1 DUF177 domain-containing protein [Campylobacter helveticus]MCR2065598.1 DUF177 domain-containing protein [Campylobacter helveticus]
MKIAFSRINSTAYPFKLNLENIVFEGNLSRINPKLVKMQAKMQGFVYRPCDRCGAEMELRIDENLELLVSDGFYKDPKNELSDTIEFFDSHIDLLEVAMGELEAYLSDYFYCDSCSEKD